MSNGSDKLMDTSPGGENTPYEAQDTFNQPPAKQSGTFDDSTSGEATPAGQEASREKEARGERTAENVRYGQAISEQGFGGETVQSSGSAETGVGFGGTAEGEGSVSRAEGKARKEQGYGEGNDVGA